MKLITASTAALLTLVFAASASAAGEPILPLAQVTPGMSCTAKSVLSGTTPTEFPVTVKDIYREAGNSYLLVEVGGAATDSGIAQGMSGSPVYCPGPSGPAIAGALSYGIFEWGGRVGLATPIEAMLGQEVTAAQYSKAPKVVAQAIDDQRYREPTYVSGASRYAFDWLSKRMPKSTFISAQGGVVKNGSTVSSAALGANTILNPGDSIGVLSTLGDVQMGGIGTVTYRDDARMWAFGHPWYQSGPRSTWITEAPISYVVNNNKTSLIPSYKLGSFGPTIGKLDYDGPYAVSGVFGQEPTSIPVSTTTSGPGLKTVKSEILVANESALGWPGDNIVDYSSAMSNIDSVVGSFSDTLPNGMTLEGCWSIKIKDVKDPFAFCNKFAGMIWGGTLPLALNALAENNLVITPLIEQASFANLQVESISTTVKAARGGQLAKLQKVRQSGKSRKVTVTYLNNKSELQTFTANLPKIKNKRGKTLTLRAQTNGDQASLVTNIQIPDSDNDNSSSSEPIAMPDGVPQITSEDEMRSFVESLDGINKLAGKVGGKRFQVALPKDFVALPVGKVSTRLR